MARPPAPVCKAVRRPLGVQSDRRGGLHIRPMPHRMHLRQAHFRRGRYGHRPLWAEPLDPGANRSPVPGGHTGRPYGRLFVGLEKVYHIPGEMETFSLGTAKMGLTAGVGYGIMASPVKKGLFFLPFSFRGNSISLPGCGREAKLRRCRTCASKSL